ncbi:MAG: 4-phosphoerythronate dehydrogenase PdxB [Bacteroidales bacterium]|nr:4-phosphoerythronate dehydrogenase PdxB [Bacteroidales bacterium]
MKIVADNKIPFLKGAFEDKAEIIYLPGADISRTDLIDADALIVRTRTNCNAALLEGTSVKFIATATIGFDHIDADYCRANGIEWTNAPGCNSSSVEQYIVAVILNLAEKKRFSVDKFTIGIIGVGNVGKKVARVAEALGMKVLLNDPPRERNEAISGFVSLEEIKNQADIITFHVPLNKEGEDKTFHLADKEFIGSMKKDSILINTSRGEVVDNQALKEALKDNYLQAAVLDVWENEPDIDTDLLSLVDISTSHIAGYSTDGKANGTTMSVHAISKFFKLELDSWIPNSVPSPENSILEIECSELSKQEIIHNVYRKCYDISNDDKLLKLNPQDFENLRGTYRVRREASSYSVSLKNNKHKDLEDILRNLGFTL